MKRINQIKSRTRGIELNTLNTIVYSYNPYADINKTFMNSVLVKQKSTSKFIRAILKDGEHYKAFCLVIKPTGEKLKASMNNKDVLKYVEYKAGV